MQGGGKDISVGSTVVQAGAPIVVTGPPGETVFYKPDGTLGGGKSVVLGADGKATVPAPTAPCTLTLLLMSDPTKFVSVTVIQLVK